MNLAPRSVSLWIALSILAFAPLSTHAQSCQTSSDLEDASRTAITAAGQRYFDMVAKGDVASLRQNAIPSLAVGFLGDRGHGQRSSAGSRRSAGDRKGRLSAGRHHSGAARRILLRSFRQDRADREQRRFLSRQSASRQVWRRSAGRDFREGTNDGFADPAAGGNRLESRRTLHQSRADRRTDSEWFLARAREYKTKGQVHNACFYFTEARSLISPLHFMSTLATDKLYDESQSAQPPDIPADGKTVDLAAGTATYKAHCDVSADRGQRSGFDREISGCRHFEYQPRPIRATLR